MKRYQFQKKKINEYENEISKLNKIIKENENNYNKERKILETKIKLGEHTIITFQKYKEEVSGKTKAALQ